MDRGRRGALARKPPSEMEARILRRAGFALAGGQSARMGTNKARMRCGRTARLEAVAAPRAVYRPVSEAASFRNLNSPKDLAPHEARSPLTALSSRP